MIKYGRPNELEDTYIFVIKRWYIMMKTPEGVKNDYINCLERCLHKMKFHDDGRMEADYRFLYQYIFTTILTMNTLDSVCSIEYYKKRMYQDEIKQLMSKFHIDISK